MQKIIDKKQCTGCHACFNLCPTNAITMVEDEKGFKTYKINQEKCIDCGRCKRICPVLNLKKIKNRPKAFAVINKNEEVRVNSSSGGVFTLLAEYILENNGIVFGAQFDENWNVKHSYIDKKENIYLFRGSKYLQSTIGNTYKEAKQFLREGKKVLFTGTPCQIEGLKAYLNQNYENLYTQDIVCHGVPSPKAHQKYLEYIKNEYNVKTIKNIYHRTKSDGWKNWTVQIKFDNNKKYSKKHNEDIYMQAFLKNAILRDSCYNCKFKKKNRISDITLADFWGIEKVLPEMDDNKGTSLTIINSEKGEELFNNIKEKITYKNVDFEEAIKHNPSMTNSAIRDIKSKKFLPKMDQMSFDKLVKKYTYTPSILKRGIVKVKAIIKKL